MHQKIKLIISPLIVGIIFIFSTENILANDILSPYVNDKTPAFATLIVKNGKTVFKGVQGCAILENGKCVLQAKFDTPFSICSVTKQFTAASILMLEEEGKLSTDDYITKYIPDLPPQFKGIRIRHLIFHISGIPDYIGDPGFRDYDLLIKQGKKVTANEALTFIKNLHPDPYNKAYVYSNSEYVLLAKIIENVSGESYQQFLQQRFFDRFGMKNAFVMAALDQHGNYAHPYKPWPLYTPENWMEAITLNGEGGIFMSINDFEKWVNAFDNHKIFAKEATMQKFLSVGKYDDRKDVVVWGTMKYGYGLLTSQENKNGKEYKVVGHEGGMPGIEALFSNISNSGESIWVVYMDNAGAYQDPFAILDQAKINY